MTIAAWRPASPASSSFDLNGMRSRPLGRAFVRLFVDSPQWWMRWLRKEWPIFRVPGLGLTVVTRFEHVQEVLARDQVFQTPFAHRMMELITGPTFVLALQDGDDYRRQRGQLMHAFKLEDVAPRISDWSGDVAEAIVERSGGRLDAVEDLLTFVPTLLCRDYYGLDIRNPTLFAQWTLAVSAYVFGWPWGQRDRHTDTAKAAASGMREVIDESIRQAHRAPDPRTIVGRLVALQGQPGGPSDDLIRAELFGMVTGFVPTNTIASAHMLEMLLRRRDMLELAQAAAAKDDDERLWRCLFEALRFKPINPGPYRVCARDYTIAEGGPDAKPIRAGSRLLVSTQSAMFDEQSVVEPERFDPDRPRQDSMVFGYGLHWCIGAFLAAAQITRTLKPLLKTRRLRRGDYGAARLERIGFMPVHLRVEFDP